MAITNGRVGKATKQRPTVLRTAESENYIEDPTDDAAPKTPTDGKQTKQRLQGIVIDGKTYTCATCKSGHRVGVCKHAHERPMKPTHPPGRPAAGAPKKVVCDCPKKCQCAKKDCKCARDCACTQSMYMLVYIPGPGEENRPYVYDDLKGTWKLGEQVVTDLKGNILTDEEIAERQKQKEAQKDDSLLGSRSASISTIKEIQSPLQATPIACGGSCAHKQAVIKERQDTATPQLHTFASSSASIQGCNCGTACSCAFCPQHPNNQTSQNLARQQTNRFITQHQFHNDANTFKTINPFGYQDVSCMGGQPQFALSRHPVHPTFANFEQAFPSVGGGGYMLAYPMHGRATPTPVSNTNSLTPATAPVMNDMTPTASPVISDLATTEVPIINDFNTTATPIINDFTTTATPIFEDFTTTAVPLINDFNTTAIPIINDMMPTAVPNMNDFTTPAVSNMNDMMPTALPIINDMMTPVVPTFNDLTHYDTFNYDAFDIDDAIVANDGPNGWQYMRDEQWEPNLDAMDTMVWN